MLTANPRLYRGQSREPVFTTLNKYNHHSSDPAFAAHPRQSTHTPSDTNSTPTQDTLRPQHCCNMTAVEMDGEYAWGGSSTARHKRVAKCHREEETHARQDLSAGHVDNHMDVLMTLPQHYPASTPLTGVDSNHTTLFHRKKRPCTHRVANCSTSGAMWLREACGCRHHSLKAPKHLVSLLTQTPRKSQRNRQNWRMNTKSWQRRLPHHGRPVYKLRSSC